MKNLQYYVDDRHPTWLELFFDLVFAASISVVTHILAETDNGHISTQQLLLIPIEFVPVWWIWATHTLYSNRFDTDGKEHRIPTLTIMFLMVTMSTFLGDGLLRNFPSFIAFYVVIRIILAGMYLAAMNRLDGSKTYAYAMGLAVFFGAIFTATSLLFNDPIREIIFISGILLEMGASVLISLRVKAVSVHGDHLVERIGLLSLILLGESVISLVAGLRGIEWTHLSIMGAVTGFLMIGAIWWTYFDSIELPGRERPIQHGLVLIYSHVLFCMGLAILANVIRHTILSDLAMEDFRIQAILGLTLFYTGMQIGYFVAIPASRYNIIVNSVVCISITIASTFLYRPAYALIGMTLAMFFYGYSNFRWALRQRASA